MSVQADMKNVKKILKKIKKKNSGKENTFS